MKHPLYTEADLASRELLDRQQQLPARLAVLGYPVAHSASPAMHQAALDALNLAMRYIKIEVQPGRVAAVLDRLRELDFVGVNVTVPHKFEALRACEALDPAAAALGVVNTIGFRDAGMMGWNTDGVGFSRAVTESLGMRITGSSVLIVGAGGGAGQALAAQCAREQAAALVLVNRSLAKIQELAAHLQSQHPHLSIRCLALDSPDLQPACVASQLIVNTSSLGLKRDDPSPLPVGCLAPHHCVFDTIYQPAITPLLQQAEQIGCRHANGLGMLLHQGVAAFAHWFDGREPLEAMRAGLRLTIGQ